MRTFVLLLCVVSLCSCATPDSSRMLVHLDGEKVINRIWINTPEGWTGSGGERNGQIPVTKVEYCNDTGWAIDYHLMFVARSTDKGRTWHVVEDGKCHMPWGLHVVSKDCAWVWGSYTTETSWYSISSFLKPYQLQ